MGACTITLDSSPGPTEDWGSKRVMFGTLNLSNSYANGAGDTWTAGNFGLAVVDALILTPDVASAATNIFVPVVIRASNGQSGNIQAFGAGTGASGLTEISNTTNLSGAQYRLRFQAIGV